MRLLTHEPASWCVRVIGTRYLVDPALVGAVHGDLLGRLLDTFVASQMRAKLAVTASRPRRYHVRQQQGRLEIDLLAESGDGRLIAIEVKADATPSRDAARHLAALRDRVGEAFVAGIVFHTGPRLHDWAARIIAAPISTLWA